MEPDSYKDVLKSATWLVLPEGRTLSCLNFYEL